MKVHQTLAPHDCKAPSDTGVARLIVNRFRSGKWRVMSNQGSNAVTKATVICGVMVELDSSGP